MGDSWTFGKLTNITVFTILVMEQVGKRLPWPKKDMTSLSCSQCLVPLFCCLSPLLYPQMTLPVRFSTYCCFSLLNTPNCMPAFKASASTSVFAEPLSSHTGVGLIQLHGMAYVYQFSIFLFFTLFNLRKFCEIKHAISEVPLNSALQHRGTQWII